MTTYVELLEAEVLQLPPAERARLVQALVTSLDEDVGVEEAWAAEVGQRLKQLDAGEVAWVDGQTELAKLRARYA